VSVSVFGSLSYEDDEDESEVCPSWLVRDPYRMKVYLIV
jgi:hypothetical protein